uniref:Tubulin, delta 1 n=1 Tax=Sinocyclocheilus anshuiensis TaxID=1608454 RepID=A0A671MEV3_9TELE
MSVVSLQLSQCGNQIGHELFSVISDDSSGPNRKKYKQCSDERFFYERSTGDMETKHISPRSRALETTGRMGKKYALGLSFKCVFCVHGPRHEEAVEDLVRMEMERCDLHHDECCRRHRFWCGYLHHSTFEGLYITTNLVHVPLLFILTLSLFTVYVVLPFQVIVQNYNSVLTLSHLYQLSDAILVHENDTVHKICSRLMNIKHISISDVNKVIAHQLASVLQPAYTADSPCHYSTNPIGELLTSLVCHPEYKLLSLCNIPQMSSTSLAYSVFNWLGLLKHLRQMLIASARMEEGIDWTVSASGGESNSRHQNFNVSLVNLLILRGKDVSTAVTDGFKDPALYVPWLKTENSFSTWTSPVAFNGYKRSAILVSNSQSHLKPLDNIVRKAWNMFASRAYVHQYTKFGISEEDFLDGFTALEQIISSYTHL